jgi:integrase
MTAIRDSLAQYVAARRALGASFYEPALALGHFVDLLEHEGTEFISTDLALRWATTPVSVERATWGRRLSQVRGFARWMNTVDSRNQIPPARLLSARRRRNAPHIYTEQEINLLMIQAAQLRSRTGMRALTYSTLIGLLVATGLRPGEALRLNRSDVDLVSGTSLHPGIEVRQIALCTRRRIDPRRTRALCSESRPTLPAAVE